MRAYWSSIDGIKWSFLLLLTVITTVCLICVVFPFKVRRMNRSVARAVVGGVWVFGAMLSVIPILGLGYFYDKKRSVGFYGKSAVCLPLQLSLERMAGWEYAAGIFIGLIFWFRLFTFLLLTLLCLLQSETRQRRLGQQTWKENHNWLDAFSLLSWLISCVGCLLLWSESCRFLESFMIQRSKLTFGLPCSFFQSTRQLIPFFTHSRLQMLEGKLVEWKIRSSAL